jgi:hypothetical protein
MPPDLSLPSVFGMNTLSSVEQDDSGSELNSGKENFAELIVTCCDGAKMLEFVEEALGEVALHIFAGTAYNGSR